MRLTSADFFCCPACNGKFNLIAPELQESEVIAGTLECYECRRQFKIADGLPNLNFPESLEEADRAALLSYNRHSIFYDLRMRWLALKLGIWEAAFMQTRSRQRLVNRLNLEDNDTVLETGTGTGIALPCIVKHIGETGKLYGIDISPRMLKVARWKMKMKGIRGELAQANASYLPYQTNTFDGVLHIGGWNTFADKKRAMREMHRVGKPGSKIVIMDEGLSETKKKTRAGRRLINQGGEYTSKPPIELIPDKTEDVRVNWIWNDIYWVVEFTKTF